MKTINNNWKQIILAPLLIVIINNAFSQEKKEDDLPRKLDFLVSVIPDDSILSNGSPLFDLQLKIQNQEIINLTKLYLKMSSGDPREIYFIRAIDKEVLKEEKDVAVWEKEQEKNETEIDKARRKLEKEAYKERYPKQKGKKVKKIKKEGGGTELTFGPFAPGDYQLYVRVVDQEGISYTDTHNLTINSEIEPE
jgi:hypothetical protein